MGHIQNLSTEPGTVYWITGLSGAGKTTIGTLLYEKVKSQKDNVVFLDGDALRNAIAADLGYTKDDRHESAQRNIRLCKLLADQGFDVVCCTICMFEDIRKWSRENNKNYQEIYIKAPLDVLKQRNQKGLYKSNADELVGFGIGMEEPMNPDCVLLNDGRKSPQEMLGELLEKI